MMLEAEEQILLLCFYLAGIKNKLKRLLELALKGGGGIKTSGVTSYFQSEEKRYSYLSRYNKYIYF